MKKIINHSPSQMVIGSSVVLCLIALTVYLTNSPPLKIYHLLFWSMPAVCFLYRLFPTEKNIYLEFNCMIVACSLCLFLLSIFWSLDLPVEFTLITMTVFFSVKTLLTILYTKWFHAVLDMLLFAYFFFEIYGII